MTCTWVIVNKKYSKLQYVRLIICDRSQRLWGSGIWDKLSDCLLSCMPNLTYGETEGPHTIRREESQPGNKQITFVASISFTSINSWLPYFNWPKYVPTTGLITIKCQTAPILFINSSFQVKKIIIWQLSKEGLFFDNLCYNYVTIPTSNPTVWIKGCGHWLQTVPITPF